jgi:hypothetical protein
MTDSILDDLFLSCALTAFLMQSHAQKGWPDSEATRCLAYRLYEAVLADENRKKRPSLDREIKTS